LVSLGGKLIRGLTVVDVQRTLVSANQNRSLTELEVARASVLGWAVEFLQAFFLVADDVMDDSHTRRGQPCWYKLPQVGNIAINDSFLLESFVFTLLKRHFGSEPYYGDLLDLFLEVTLKTELGQLLDLTSQPLDSTTGKAIMDLDRFTIHRHALIVKYKTAFYTFYLPVAIGMITSGIPTNNKKAYQLAQKICCIMGEYFQIQDDYLDCYGDPATIGKGKCRQISSTPVDSRHVSVW
jgi:farnesyl diphosphate synthase